MDNLNELGLKFGEGTTWIQKAKPLHCRWSAMKYRCSNKNHKQYHTYGGAGIKVCKEWEVYEHFEKDMLPTYKKGLTLDRINNKKGYSKLNCRWATLIQQANNKINNIKYKNETATQASYRLGGTQNMVRERLQKGWGKRDAFTRPKFYKI